jgi:hypothetical protein
MSHALRAGLASLLLLLPTQFAHADLLLSLSADAPDLNSLTLGQSFNVQVSLSGLNTGDTLDFLAATVTFDGTRLGTPSITAGPIVPDPTGYIQSALSGLADASYDALFASSGSPITDNGLFYSFSVVVQGLGQGTIAFDFVDSSGSDASGAPLPTVTAGGTLSFSTVSAVPEPSGFVLMGTATLALLAYAGHHRLKRSACPTGA